MHIVVTLQDIGFLIFIGLTAIAGAIIFLLDKWDKRK